MKYVSDKGFYNKDISISNNNSVYCTNGAYNSNIIMQGKDCENHDCQVSGNECNNHDNKPICTDKKHDDLCYDEPFCTIAPKDNCCKVCEHQLDPSKLKTVCTYLDIIYDEGKAIGTPIIDSAVVESADGNTVKEQYKPCDKNCCIPCNVDENSVYTIERMQVKVKRIKLSTEPSENQILINGLPALDVELQGDGSLVVMIDPALDDEACNNKCLGTKASVLLNALGGWELLLSYELCGRVTTTEGTCKFAVTFDTLTNVPYTTTFVATEVCIPDLDEDSTPYMNVKFKTEAQIINPSLAIVNGDLELSTTLLINPYAKLEIIKNAKVCLHATVGK